MKATGIHEYTRKCKREGALLARVVFFILLYAFMLLVTLFFTLIMMSIPAFIIFGGLTAGVVFVTLPLMSESRDYEIVDGSFRIYKIYGGAASKKVFEGELRDMLRICPYRSEADVKDVEKVRSYVSDTASNEIYYAVYKKGDMRCAVIFDGDEKFYNAAAFYCARNFSR